MIYNPLGESIILQGKKSLIPPKNGYIINNF